MLRKFNKLRIPNDFDKLDEKREHESIEKASLVALYFFTNIENIHNSILKSSNVVQSLTMRSSELLP